MSAKKGAQQITFVSNSKHQEDFFHALREPNHRIILMLGGRQAGKTYVGAAGVPYFCYARKSNIVKNLGWVISPTYDQSEVAMRAFEKVAGWYQHGGCIISHNKNEHAYMLAPAKGQTVPFRLEFKTAKEPDYLRGGSVDFIWMDEGAFVETDLWDVIQPCVLASGGPIWITTTPNGLNWLYDKIYIPSLSDNTIQTIRGKTSDNKALNRIQVAQMASRYSILKRRQEMEAEFVSFEGMVYHMFKRENHILAPYFDTKTGMGKDGSPLEGEILAGIDHGFRDPFVYLWILKNGNTFIVLDEYYQPGRPTEHHASKIKTHILETVVYRRWADPSGGQSRADLERYGISTFPAQNDLKQGIDAVAGALERGKLFIASNCTNLLREIQAYHYKPGNKGEVPVDVDNHCLDALRYVIYSEATMNVSTAINPWFEPQDAGYKIHEGSGPHRQRFTPDGVLDERGFNPWENPWHGPEPQFPSPESAPPI